METVATYAQRRWLEVAGGGAVALSMDEQRILDEMERRLADNDPRLASRLAAFGRPGLGTALQSPRARLLASLATLALIAVIAVMVYAMLPFRAGSARHLQAHRPAASPGTTQPVIAPAGGRTSVPRVRVSRTP
jgi:Protein of unknown function (DUF3040)